MIQMGSARDMYTRANLTGWDGCAMGVLRR